MFKFLNKDKLKYFYIALTCIQLLLLSTYYSFSGIFVYSIWAIDLIVYAFITIPDFFKTAFDKKKIIFIILILLCLYSTYLTRNENLLITLLTCWLIKDDDLKKIITFILKVTLITTFLIIISYFITKYGFNYEFFELERNGINRVGLGFGHPNTLGLTIFNIIVMYLYINFKNNKIIKYLISFIIICLTYFVCYSRSAFIVSIIGIILFFILEKDISILNKIIKSLSYYIFPLAGIIFMLVVLLYNKEIDLGIMINRLLEGRIYLTDLGLKEFGINIFGINKNIIDAFSLNNYFYLDSLFAYLSVEYGTIWFFILSVLIYLSLKESNIEDSLLIILFSIYSMSERNGLSILGICSLLVLKSYFSNFNNKSIIKE